MAGRADGLGGGEQRAGGHHAPQDRPCLGSAEHAAAAHRDRVEAGRSHRHRLVEASLRSPGEPGRAGRRDRDRGLAVEGGDDRQLADGLKLLDRDLLPAYLQSVAPAREPRPGPLSRPAGARLQQSDADGVLAGNKRAHPGRQRPGLRRKRQSDRGAAEEGHRCEMAAEHAGDEAELDGPQLTLVAYAERAELDKGGPGPASPLGGSADSVRRRDPLPAEQRVDRLADPGLFLGEFEFHDYSWGSARTRSAMMLRWICRVPPYTEAARE
jgi:hypothetical protein